VEYQGSYAAIPQAVSAFMADFFKQGLTPASPLLGIYLNYAKDTAEADLKWQIGLGIPTGTTVNAPLKKAMFKSQEVIHMLRKGPYETVGETYDMLHKTIEEKGYLINGPAFERYLSDPAQVAAQDLETEIFIPVRRK
jgi:effector-binding domain-containing protein